MAHYWHMDMWTGPHQVFTVTLGAEFVQREKVFKHKVFKKIFFLVVGLPKSRLLKKWL